MHQGTSEMCRVRLTPMGESDSIASAMRGLGIAAALTASVLISHARAEPPARLQVGAEPGSCPSAELVVGELAPLLPATVLAVGGDAAGPNRAWIEDLGGTFRVVLPEAERTFEDEARDCAERARVAAVFAALTLDPPTFGAPATPQTPVPEPSPVRRSQTAETALRWDADFGVMPAVAPWSAAAGPVVAAAAAARVALGSNGIGASLGATVLGPVTLEYGAHEFRLISGLVDASALASYELGWARLTGELGPLLSIQWGRGENLPKNRASTRLNGGVRVGATFRFVPARRVGPYVGAAALLWPWPTRVEVEPVGEIGSLPAVWFGATAGLSVRAD